MSMAVDAVFFDLDGTVTEPFVGITNAIIYALEKMGAKIPEREELKPFIGPPLMYSFKNYCGMSEVDAARAVSLYREYYSDKGIFELTLYDGISDVMKRLHDRGIKQYLATSKPEPFAVRIAEKFGLEFLDGVAGASFDSSRAEKDQVIEYALKRFCASPSRTVMIGDRKYDIEGAKKFGLKSVGVLYGYGTREELERAGADRIAEKPSEIDNVIFEI